MSRLAACAPIARGTSDAVARGALPADDLAVAGLSGRRVLLFERHRMGGRGRRYHRRRNAARLARSHADVGRGIERRHFLRADASRRGAWRRCRVLPKSPSLPRHSCRSRERHLETTTLGRAFVEVTRAAWPCAALAKLPSSLARSDRLSGRGRRRLRRSRHPARAGAARFPDRAGVELDIRRRAPDSARPYRRPAPVAGARTGGRRRPRNAPWPRRSTISAARRSAPISPSVSHETQYTRLFRS